MSGLCAICGSGRYCWLHDENLPEPFNVEQLAAAIRAVTDQPYVTAAGARDAEVLRLEVDWWRS